MTREAEQCVLQIIIEMVSSNRSLTWWPSPAYDGTYVMMLPSRRGNNHPSLFRCVYVVLLLLSLNSPYNYMHIRAAKHLFYIIYIRPTIIIISTVPSMQRRRGAAVTAAMKKWRYPLGRIFPRTITRLRGKVPRSWWNCHGGVWEFHSRKRWIAKVLSRQAAVPRWRW